MRTTILTLSCSLLVVSACADEGGDVPPLPYTVDAVLTQAAAGASAAVIATCKEAADAQCPRGFVPFSVATGTTPGFCDACVPKPRASDFAECYVDADCPQGAKCLVDLTDCQNPAYCAGCWDGCTANGNLCTMCVDCACGGTCSDFSASF